MVDDKDRLFEEVDEDLRRERALKLWKQYGNYVIGGALAVVVGTGAYVAWRDYERKRMAAEGERFVAAADLAAAGDTERALAAFAHIARQGAAGYATLARLREAGLKARHGDAAGGLAIYLSIAADERAGAEFRDAATMLAALSAADGAGGPELERRLAALSASTSPWRHTALEIAAVVAAKNGDGAKARELYAKIADDPAAPLGLRARAAEMIQALGG
ncbi:MAG: tetratricopeptide repeat protein [Pseudomonadota bacterium]